MTYLQIINIIKDTALAQPNVNSVVREFLDLNREDAKYSAVVIQDRDGSRDRIVEQDYVTYTWHLGYVDRLTYDESNRDDIISTGINIINNIVNTIRNTWFPELEVSIVDRINTFDQRFTAQCAGVYVVLAVNAQVSDCVDSESTDLYDTYDAKITANGVYHFVPSGRPVDEIDIVVNVENQYKPEDSLVKTITSNGSYHYSPEEGRVFNEADITVDVHPSDKLVDTITSNGITDLSGEWKDASITVDVHPKRDLRDTVTINNVEYQWPGEWRSVRICTNIHPSDKLVETITSNGTTSFSGEWKDADITVAVPSDQKPETICEKVIQENGSFHYYPESGEVFNDVHITTDVHPTDKLVETITNNGSYSYPGEYAGAEITVSVSAEKPEESLEKTITSNGNYHYDPSAGSVFSNADITVDVHPSESLSKTYTTNGIKTITGEFNGGSVNVDVHPTDKLVKTITNNGTTDLSGEWKDASITVDVHPSDKLVKTITSNGTKSFSGEWKDAAITVAIPSDQKPEESLEKTITSNGSFHYDPSAGSVFSDADITVDVHPTAKLSKTYTKNGTYNVSGEWKDAAITVNVPTNVNANTLRISQTEYDNLSVKDPDTIYLIYY